MEMAAAFLKKTKKVVVNQTDEDHDLGAKESESELSPIRWYSHLENLISRWLMRILLWRMILMKVTFHQQLKIHKSENADHNLACRTGLILLYVQTVILYELKPGLFKVMF